MKQILSLILALVMCLSLCACQVNISSGEKVENDPKDFEYEEVNGGLKITKYTGKSNVVVIPSVIDNKKVVDVDNAVFSGNVSLKEVTLPESISYISFELFENCEALEKITYLGSITRINDVSSSALDNYLSSMPSLRTLEVNGIQRDAVVNDLSGMLTKSNSLENLVITEIIDDSEGGFFRYNIGACRDGVVNISIPEKALSKYLQQTAYRACQTEKKHENLSIVTWGYYLTPQPPYTDSGEIIEVSDAYRNQFIDEFTSYTGGKINSCDFLAWDQDDHIRVYVSGEALIDGTTYLFVLAIGEYDKDYVEGLKVWKPSEVFFEYFLIEYVDLYEILPDEAKLCVLFGKDKINVNGVLYQTESDAVVIE